MTSTTITIERIARAAAFAALFAPAAMMPAGIASASECPTEHRLAEHRHLDAPPDSVKGREILQWIDVSNVAGVDDGMALRMRKLVVGPGGFVPLH